MSWVDIGRRLTKAESACNVAAEQLPDKQLVNLMHRIGQEFREIRTMMEQQVAEDRKVTPEEVSAAIASIVQDDDTQKIGLDQYVSRPHTEGV